MKLIGEHVVLLLFGARALRGNPGPWELSRHLHGQAGQLTKKRLTVGTDDGEIHWIESSWTWD